MYPDKGIHTPVFIFYKGSKNDLFDDYFFTLLNVNSVFGV